MSKHTVIDYDKETGDIFAASFHMQEAEAEKKRQMLADEGKTARVLYHYPHNPQILRLRWDEERGRLVKRSETLTELRGPAAQAVRELAERLSNEPIETPAGLVQADLHSRRTIADFAALVRQGIPSPHGGHWRMTDNSMASFDDAALLALDEAARDRDRRIRERKWALIDGIMQETEGLRLKGFDAVKAWADE